MPFFSIITVCYNSQNTIADTLNSVLLQEFQDYEFIVIDGGSTDNTIQILKGYEIEFKGRMRWISEPDKGIYDAFNKGCKMAEGKYIWIVNSDDYIDTEALSYLYLKLKTYDDEPIAIGGLYYVDECKNVYASYMTSCKDVEIAYKKDWMIAHPAMLIPRSYYQEYGYYDDVFKVAADKDLFHRFYAKGAKFITLDRCLTYMRDGGASNTMSYRKEEKEQRRFLLKKYGYGLHFLFAYVRWNARRLKKVIK